MKFFNPKPDEKIIKLLQASKQEFRFDENRVKNKLLFDINETPQVKAPQKVFGLKFIKYSAAPVIVLILISATFAVASTAQPGDKLFALDKLGEKVVLSLPLSAEQKADFQTHIVTQRLEALTQLRTDAPSQSKSLETVKESDETLENAINTVSANKDKFEAKGQSGDARKMTDVLNQLDNLAEKHEEQIQALEDSTASGNFRQEIDSHLNQIKNSRHKVRLELKLEDSNDQN